MLPIVDAERGQAGLKTFKHAAANLEIGSLLGGGGRGSEGADTGQVID